ncbi:prephenate dehydrogenase [Alloiococcus sp. CFN-8]|uniref:prephenate dehydrogenase n=1 Tax=Alloiococcus sp. CFN-8 TaxID=3416081 RepID=UPI003CEA6001
MVVGVVGLGLIGGSMARAIKKNTNHIVYGHDHSEAVLMEALNSGAIDGILENNLSCCDMIFIALYPKATIAYIKNNARSFKKDTLIIDCCGIKRYVCSEAFTVAEENGFKFIGGHPMAGTESWGFNSSRDNLFNGASMILTPKEELALKELELLEDFFYSLGFGSLKISTPEEHDHFIAYTSQLAHVLSGAYVKTPSALKHKGFSAGSFKDMTRVAKLNEDMWCELFIENKDFLIDEIDSLIERLLPYSEALKKSDVKSLKELLREGRVYKERVEKEL